MDSGPARLRAQSESVEAEKLMAATRNRNSRTGTSPPKDLGSCRAGMASDNPYPLN